MQMSTCTPFDAVGPLKAFEVGFIGEYVCDLLVQVGLGSHYWCSNIIYTRLME